MRAGRGEGKKGDENAVDKPAGSYLAAKFHLPSLLNKDIIPISHGPKYD
jgi:hypothetical protein